MQQQKQDGDDPHAWRRGDRPDAAPHRRARINLLVIRVPTIGSFFSCLLVAASSAQAARQSHPPSTRVLPAAERLAPAVSADATPGWRSGGAKAGVGGRPLARPVWADACECWRAVPAGPGAWGLGHGRADAREHPLAPPARARAGVKTRAFQKNRQAFDRRGRVGQNEGALLG